MRIESSDVVSAASGDYHNLYLKNDGSLWSMGRNWFGELGDGTMTDLSTPVEIEPSGVSAISAGSYHGIYVKNDGSVWLVGSNQYGQLGMVQVVLFSNPRKPFIQLKRYLQDIHTVFM